MQHLFMGAVVVSSYRQRLAEPALYAVLTWQLQVATQPWRCIHDCLPGYTVGMVCLQEDGDVMPMPRQRRRKAAPEKAPPMMSPIKSLFGRRVGSSSFGSATSIFQSIHQANAGEPALSILSFQFECLHPSRLKSSEISFLTP